MDASFEVMDGTVCEVRPIEKVKVTAQYYKIYKINERESFWIIDKHEVIGRTNSLDEAEKMAEEAGLRILRQAVFIDRVNGIEVGVEVEPEEEKE